MAKGYETKDDGWKLYVAETTCDVTGTKVSGTESYSKKRWFKGTPSEVKGLIQMEFDGYKYEINNIHTIEKYRRHNLSETNHGTIKNYEEKIIQVDSFGSGDQPFNKNPVNYNSNNYDNEEEEEKQSNDPEAGLTHKTATLKNMIDNIMSDNRFQWLAIVGLAIAITVVVVLLR